MRRPEDDRLLGAKTAEDVEFHDGERRSALAPRSSANPRGTTFASTGSVSSRAERNSGELRNGQGSRTAPSKKRASRARMWPRRYFVEIERTLTAGGWRMVSRFTL